MPKTLVVTGSSVDNDGYYYVECILGDPCKTHSFSSDGSGYKCFYYYPRLPNMKATGNSRTRSVDNNLGNVVMINTSPLGVGVDSTCNYDSEVEVSAGPFTIQDVSITGTLIASGTLDLGFTMLAGDGSDILLGNYIVLKTSWTLDLSDSCITKIAK